MLHYFFEMIIVSALLYLVYVWVCQQENALHFRRIFLSVALVLSVTLPAIHLNSWIFSDARSAMVNTFLPSITVKTENATVSYSIPHPGDPGIWILVGKVVYILILILLISRIFLEILKLGKFVLHSNRQGNLILTDGRYPTFTFLHFIFYDNSVQRTIPQKDQILAHEYIHLKQGHSYEIIIMELIKSIFWINPFFWLLVREQRKVHEFLADQTVAGRSDIQDYERLLVQEILQNNQLTFVPHFSKSLTLKRIAMLKTKNEKLKTWKSIMVALVVTGISLVSACDTDTNIEENLSSDTSKEFENDATLPDGEVFQIVEKPAKYPGGIEEFTTYVQSNLTYPEAAQEAQIGGKVFVQFIVRKDGSVTNVKIVKGLGNGFDEEARRVVEQSANWIPAEQDGKKVNMSLILPISFQPADSKSSAASERSFTIDLTDESVSVGTHLEGLMDFAIENKGKSQKLNLITAVDTRSADINKVQINASEMGIRKITYQIR